MAKWASQAVLDAPLDLIAGATSMSLCSAQPTTRTEADSTYMLAKVTMAGGDFTKAAGSPSGRKVTTAAKNSVTITNSGTGNHVAFYDGTNLLFVTTCSNYVANAGQQVNFPAITVTNPLPA
jgi:hypothetical protein